MLYGIDSFDGFGEIVVETMLIFKIVGVSAWQAAKVQGEFQGAAVDLQDGYIHFSTAQQVRETAAKHFYGQRDLLLVAVDPERLGEALRWEPSRGGDLFPHLYAPLSMDAVVAESSMPWDSEGKVHQFSDLLLGD